MSRKYNILAILLAVLMVVAMMPAVTQEAFAAEKNLDFTKDINGLKEGKILTGSTISLNLEDTIMNNEEMMEAFLEGGSGEVYLRTYAPVVTTIPFDYDNSSGIAKIKVTKDLASVGYMVNVIIKIDSDSFYTPAIYVVENNTLNVKGKTATIKYSKLKKSTQYRSVTKVINFIDKGKGDKSYSLTSATKAGKSYKKYISIDYSTGKVTVKKGLKKGTYTVKAKVKAEGDIFNYLSATKNVTFKIKVR